VFGNKLPNHRKRNYSHIPKFVAKIVYLFGLTKYFSENIIFLNIYVKKQC
jgi:hypothetical protein